MDEIQKTILTNLMKIARQSMTDLATELKTFGYPDKAEEAKGAARILEDWIKGVEDGT